MDEIGINTTTAGDQDSTGVAALRGIQFAVVWVDHASGNIKGRMLGVNAVPSSGEFNVNLPGPPGTRRSVPRVIETAVGLAVAWTEQAPGVASQLKLRTLDADSLSGPEIQVSTAEVEPLVWPALARLPDNGFIVVWADKRDSERIRAQRFDVDGNRNGAEFRVNTTPGLHREPMVTSLSNGNVVIGWRARSASPLLVHLQIVNASGPVGGEVTTALNITDAVIAPLDAGRFVIASVRSALDGEPGFDITVAQLTVFDPNGAAANLHFAATSDTRIQSSWPTLVPLPGGRFLLAWAQLNVDNPAAGTNVMVRLFSATGPIGRPVQVNTRTGGTRFAVSAAAVSAPGPETAFVAWADDTATAPDPSGRAIKGRAMAIPAAGF